jgi:putative transposase
MPNHVHLLVCFRQDINLLEQCYSWKHYMARRINAALSRSGRFWQSESFDHLVRDADHFERFRIYIRKNPMKVGLQDEEYVLNLPEL